MMDSGRIEMQKSAILTKMGAWGIALSLFFILAIFLCGAFYAGQPFSAAFRLVCGFSFFALSSSIAATALGILSTKADREENEKLLLAKKEGSLPANADIRFGAARALAAFKRNAPYAVALIFFIIIILLLTLAGNTAEAAKDTVSLLSFAFFSAVLAILNAMCAAFFIGQSRDSFYRYGRTIGSSFAISFIMLLSLAATMTISHFSGNDYSALFEMIFRTIYIVIGIELMISIIIEFYRPRNTAAEARPVFESRIITLFTEPGGLMRNVADTLDYQFGFSVSSSWAYRFLSRFLIPLLILWGLLFWAATAINEVGPDEVGFKESFGMTAPRMLEPGIHFTFPAPFGKVYKYSTSSTYRIFVGEHDHPEEESELDKAHGHSHGPTPQKKINEFLSVIAWTGSHNHGPEGFLTRGDGGTFSLLSMLAAIDYRINPDKLYDYAFGSADRGTLLDNLAQQAVVETLLSFDLDAIVSSERDAVCAAVGRKFQDLADRYDCGIEVAGVYFIDTHPLEAVSEAIAEALAARERSAGNVEAAEEYRIRSVPQAKSKGLGIIEEARASAYDMIAQSQGVSDEFKAQLTAFEAAPRIFKLRRTLDVWENEGAAIRKFIISSTFKDFIYELNFEKKNNLDLFGGDTLPATTGQDY